MSKRKAILIEALSALEGGGKTYLKQLFADISNYSDLRVTAVLPQSLQASLDNCPIDVVSPDIGERDIVSRWFWYRSKLPGLISSVNADAFYCPGGMLSTYQFGRAKSAVAFRNLLPFDDAARRGFPPGFVRARLKILRYLQSASFRKADLVIFLSRHTKSIIDNICPNRSGSSIVIPHGFGPIFNCCNGLGRPEQAPEEYVLYVSSIAPYKCQLEVVDAWRRMKMQRVTHEKLILAGPEFPPYARELRKRVRSFGLEHDVIVSGALPHETLPNWYRHAKLNLFASTCETFGFTLVEAMASGSPVLSSNYQPLPEIAGEAVAYFDPKSPSELAERMAKLLDDSAARSDLALRGSQQAKKFSLDASAAATWRALRALANSHS